MLLQEGRKARTLLVTYSCLMVLAILLRDGEIDFLTRRPLWALTATVCIITIAEQVGHRRYPACLPDSAFGLAPSECSVNRMSVTTTTTKVGRSKSMW